MSVAGLSNADRVHKKWVHERNDSGELDVFEAARYFSGAGENLPGYNNQKKMMMMGEDRQGWRSGGRMSLDVPMRSSTIPSSTQTHHHHHNHHHGIEKEKKYKQPNSPGGRLASFLNSLFKQTSSKKKKSKSGSTQSIKDEDDSPGWRRRRRSSISHFHTHSNTNSNSISISNSIFSSSSSSITSGFRTPPPYPYPYAHTPTKSTYKDFRCYSDHHCKQLPVSSFSNNNNNINATHVKSSTTTTTTTTTLQNGADKRSISDYAWLDDKLKFGNGLSQKFRMSTDKYPLEDKESIRKEFSEVDEGADSDSSSDLFELQNYDLGYYSSGLPVYETAHLDSIKRGPPFCNAPV